MIIKKKINQQILRKKMKLNRIPIPITDKINLPYDQI